MYTLLDKLLGQAKPSQAKPSQANLLDEPLWHVEAKNLWLEVGDQPYLRVSQLDI